MAGAFGVAVDPTTGKIFVADFSNNRVLRFASNVALTKGASAEAVFGQADFTSKGAAVTATGMDGPVSLTVDGLGTLWVGDSSNYRILRFDHASTKTSGTAADGLLGQMDFVTNNFPNTPTQSSVTYVYGLAANKDGTLWASDTNSNRILRFDYASGKANGGNADAVIGQADFVSKVVTNPPTAASVSQPIGLAIDTDDHLWVGDSGTDRVLRFDHATLKSTTGASANAVLGQPSFATRFSSVSSYGFDSPSGVGIDSDGTLWVSSYNDDRVLGFHKAASKINGEPAEVILGQESFDHAIRYFPLRATTLSNPRQIAGDTSGNIWIACEGGSRVLRFSPPASSTTPPPKAAPTLTISGKKVRTTTAASIQIGGTATGAAGLARVEYRNGSAGAFHTASGTSAWKFKVALKPGKNSLSVRAVDLLGRISPVQKTLVIRQ
jgi:sugar lactone lactonase YvrE